MKKMLLCVLFMLLAITATAGNLGMKRSTQWISMEMLMPLDSAGNNRPVVPDSAHVMTWADKTTGQVLYSATSTTIANFGTDCKIQRDTINGAVRWVLSDSVAILNGSATTSREISGSGTLWWKGCPFVTTFTMEVIADTIQNYFTQITQSRDTLVLYDTRFDSLLAAAADAKIKTQVNQIRDTILLYDTRFDSLLAAMADANTQLKNRLLRIRDSVDASLDSFQNMTTLEEFWHYRVDTITTDSSAGKTLANGYTAIKLIRDTTNATLDSLQLYDTRLDSLLAASSDAKIKTQVNQIRDTILLYDTRLDSLLAASADAKIKTQVNQIRDTILLYDTRLDSLLEFAADANTQVKNRLLRIKDTTDAILDTLQLYDTRLVFNKSLDSLSASMESSGAMSTITKYNADADSVFIIRNVTDTLLIRVFYHVGKASGFRPDSTKLIAGPDIGSL